MIFARKNMLAIWFPALLVVANLVVKIFFLDNHDIAHDEPHTLYHAQGSLADIFQLMKSENNPPLHFLFMHFWVGWFGLDPFWVRLPSLILHVLTVWLLYHFGRKFFNTYVGLFAALLFSFSNYHLVFAYEARVYSLFALLTLASFYALFTLLGHPRSRWGMVLLISSNVLLIYAHFFGLLVPMIQLIGILLFPDARYLLRKYLLASAITAICYLPYVPILLMRFGEASGGTWISTPGVPALYNYIRALSNQPVIAVLFLLCLGIAVLIYFLQKRPGIGLFTRLTILWFPLPFFGLFLLSLQVPVFLDRYLVFLSLAFYLCVALAAHYLSQVRIITFIPILALVGMALTFRPSIEGIDKKQLASVITEYREAGAQVYLCPDWMENGIAYYYNRDYFRDYGNLRARLIMDSIYPVRRATWIDTAALAHARHVLYVDGWSQIPDPKQTVRKTLRARFNQMDSITQIGNYRILHFYNTK